MAFWRHPAFRAVVSSFATSGYAINGYVTPQHVASLNATIPKAVQDVLATPQVPQHSPFWDAMHGHDVPSITNEEAKELSRGPFISSSMVANIRGENHYCSAKAQIMQAAGIDRKASSESMEALFAHGHKHEMTAIRLAAAKLGYCVAQVGTIFHPEHGCIVDSADFIAWRLLNRDKPDEESSWEIVMGEAKVRLR